MLPEPCGGAEPNLRLSDSTSSYSGLSRMTSNRLWPSWPEKPQARLAGSDVRAWGKGLLAQSGTVIGVRVALAGPPAQTSAHRLQASRGGPLSTSHHVPACPSGSMPKL